MAGALELGKAWVTVGVDGRGLAADLSRTSSEVTDSLNQTGSAAAAVQQQVSDSAKMMSMATAAMFGTIAHMGKSMLSKGLGLASEFEKTTTEMEVMMGSAEETEKTMADLTAFAVATPFAMPQILGVANQLITFGERGEHLMETLKMLGDASGGTNEKFQLLGSVFNQVRGAGKLLTQDFRQLSGRGIISLQDIAKYYKTTTAAANKMLSDGKISFESFRKILKKSTEEGGRFANMMEKTSHTMEGLTSTYKDSVSIAYRMVATPLLPYMKMLTIFATSAVNAFGALAREGGEIVSFAIVAVTAFASVGAAIFGCRIAMQLLGVQVQSTMQMFRIGIGAALRVMPWIAVAAALGALVGWFVRLKPVQEFFTTAWKIIAETLDKVTAMFTKLWKQTQGPAQQSIAVMTGFAGWVSMLGYYVDNCINRFTAFYLSILPQITQIGTLWFALTDNLQRVFNQAVSAISGYLFGGTGNWMDYFEWFVEAALSWVEYFLDMFVFWTTDLGLSWSLVCLNLQYWVQFAFDNIINIFQMLGAYIIATGAGFVVAYWEYFKDIIKAVWWVAQMIIPWGAYMVQVMGDVAYNFVVKFQTAFTEIGDFFKATWDAICAYASGGSYSEAFDKKIADLQKERKGQADWQAVEVGAEAKKKYKEATKNIANPNFVNPLAAGKAAFDSTYNALKGPGLQESAASKALKAQAQAVTDQINEKKKQDAKDRLDPNAKKKLDADKAKTDPLPAAMATLTQGKYGFAEIGNKIQDELLKGKDGDVAQKQLSALELGNQTASKQLDATKALNTGMAQ